MRAFAEGGGKCGEFLIGEGGRGVVVGGRGEGGGISKLVR